MSVSRRPGSLTLVPSPQYAPTTVIRLRRRTFCASTATRTAPRRTQDFNSGFSSSYDPTEDSGRGPMFNKAKFGVPPFYPRDLKKGVDDYVVGQDRAKKTICSVIFNHYQGLRRKYSLAQADKGVKEKQQRQQYTRDKDLHDRRRDTYTVEDESLRSDSSAEGRHQGHSDPDPDPDLMEDFYTPEDPDLPRHVKIDKSNLLLIGPTGVGKTYILETLSKKLKIPFTISDCNSFTQAGYVGQDVEACIERLLIEANYNIKLAEHGIVVLDEFDKIARRETSNNRDVAGEGVQQALLKLVEGTRVIINVKDHRSSRSASPLTGGYASPSSSASGPQGSQPSGRTEQFAVDTTNILFFFCGAFVGLDKQVIKRVSKPSIGFGSKIRSGASSQSGSKAVLPSEMYAHLPHQPAFPDPDAVGFTPLDLTAPADLQAFGFIPELIGRVHSICALSPLSVDELYRILTEPRNSLVAQYTALFETYPSKLHFTRRALYAIAERASENETGARGLKMEMQRVLAEPMFEAPMPYVLINEGCVRGTEKAGYWGKDGRFEVERRMAEEDERVAHAAVDPSVSFGQLREAENSGG